MRKLLVLPIVLSAFFAGFDVSAATARGGRSVASTLGNTENASVSDNVSDSENNQQSQGAVGGASAVAARAANRNRVKQSGVSAPSAVPGVAARVATRTSVRSAVPNTGGVPKAAPATAKPGTGVKARAATKQKAVNMGTKVAAATENTVLPQECQDAFYGCMDSFCMMANTSGGRCRCDDRSIELDAVLDQIMKLDAQSKILAEEGVERLERGKDVDTIYSMAEEAANKVLADQKKAEKELNKQNKTDGKKKSRQLDLSIFNSNSIFDTDVSGDDIGIDILGSDFSDKNGNELKNAAAKMCVTKVPSQCKDFGSMLQLVYAQKIKSDCVAYENDLKQQKMNSENLLKTAQKAVRDAAGEAYNKANKYDLGGCVMRYKQCMTGDDVCGSGFSKCVVNKMLVTKSAQTMKKIQTGATVIEIESTTFDQLSSNRIHCDFILDECEKVRNNVWNEFLKSIAPELRAAEYSAEDDQRRNCAKNVVACIREGAKNEGLEEGSDSWHIFTSDTKNVDRICKVELEQCGAYDESLKKSILSYVNVALSAIRADRCTVKIKQCLEKDTVCNEDYSNCMGVDMNFLWNNCGDVVKPDCMGKEGYETEEKLKLYISQVASGVLLNADNKIAEQCRKTLDSVMNNICGATDSCNNAGMALDDASVESLFDYKICKVGDKNSCVQTVEALTTDDVNASSKYKAEINPSVTLSQISIGSSKDNPFSVSGSNTTLQSKLNSAYNLVLNQINNDEKIKLCTEGSKARGFDGHGQSLVTQTTREDGAKVFVNLTQNAGSLVAKGVLNAFAQKYNTIYEKYKDKQVEDSAKIVSMFETAKTKEEKWAKCKEFINGRYSSGGLIKYKNVEPFEKDGQCCVARITQSCKEYTDDGTDCEEYNKEEFGEVCFYTM